MSDYKDKILIWFLQNNEGSTGKFNPWAISEELDISLEDVVATINELQKDNLITICCPECGNKASIEYKKN